MRKDLKSQMKAIAAQQKELTARLEFCDKCIDELHFSTISCCYLSGR